MVHDASIEVCGLTRVIHHRQSRHSPLHKDVECFDDGCVWVDESNVVVCSDAQLAKSLFHKSWLWHLTHLRHTNTRSEEAGRRQNNSSNFFLLKS